MKRKQGISLIVLVITIIVMVVLAAAVVVSLSNSGIINKASDAVSATNVKEVEQLANLAWAEEFIDGKRDDELKASVLGKLEDYTDKYDFEVSNNGVTVTLKGENTVIRYPELEQKYFTFEFDTTNMTAKVTGVKEEYQELGWYREHGYELQKPIGIVDNGKQITDISLPSKVFDEDGNEYTLTTIGELAFANQTVDVSKYTSITIPEGVTTIENRAFENCTEVVSASIPNSVTTIDWEAFSGCESLTNVTLSNALTTIATRTFKGCTELTSVIIPSSVTTIENSAFDSCTALTSVIIPEGVTTVNDNAFVNCTNLVSVTLPNSITDINRNAFYYTNIEYNVYNNGKYLGNDSNKYLVLMGGVDTSASTFEINNNTKTIAMYAMSNMKNIETIYIPENVENIGEAAFFNCTKLKDVKLGSGITTIKTATFSNCENLERIEIPTSVTKIEYSAFVTCPKLANVYYVGNEAKWNTIEIESFGNDSLINANKFYNYFIVN